MKLFLLFTMMASSLLITSCFKKKEPDPVAQQLKMQLKQMEDTERQRKIDQDLRDKEVARKEDAQKRLEAKRTAPIQAGEFSITIIPDPSVTNKFIVPVHVMTMSEGQAENYRSMKPANYWKTPNSAAKEIKFGTSGQSHTYDASIPFKTGDNALVIITKLPGADNAIIIRALKRNEDLSASSNINYTLTANGFLAL